MSNKNRRVLIVDDNQAIHSDFLKILAPRETCSELDDLESSLFDNGPNDNGPNDNGGINDAINDAETEGTEVRDVTFTIDSAYQGQEAVEKVQAAIDAGSRYAMAFVDMRMPPGWNGVKTIEEMWKIDPELQVVICTAYSDHSWDQIAARLGITDRLLILKKPFDKIEVCQLALALTEKSHLFDQAGIKLEQLKRMVDCKTSELRKEIAERKRVEEILLEAKQLLQHQASFDDTTETMNRRAIDAILKAALESDTGGSIGLLFVDIDHFKTVNDIHGHAVGDYVLNVVSKRLQQGLRNGDEVGRYGGEEFIVLMRNCELDTAARVGERLRANIAASPINCEGVSLEITVSIGATVTRTTDSTMDEVVARADQAMYVAKRNGRNRVEIDSDVSIGAAN